MFNVSQTQIEQVILQVSLTCNHMMIEGRLIVQIILGKSHLVIQLMVKVSDKRLILCLLFI